MTWGHNDKRLFVATGCYVHVAWVVKTVATLQYLSQRAISLSVKDEPALAKTSLPASLQTQVAALFSYTVKVRIYSKHRITNSMGPKKQFGLRGEKCI